MADPREGWATPSEAAAFWATQVHAFETEGGEHNTGAIVEPERFERIVADARDVLGWDRIKVDLYCLDHSVREVDRTFHQIGWVFDTNEPAAKVETPATVATVFRSMRVLEQYFSRYTPNELPAGTILTQDEEPDEDTEVGPVEVSELEKLDLPFLVRPL